MNRLRTVWILLGLAAANPSWGAEPISKNPFTRPGYTADRPLPGPLAAPPEDQEPLELRATLVAGGRVMANLNGEILEPGDEIQGHRLLRVTEGEAVLLRDGTRMTLLVRDDREEADRD